MNSSLITRRTAVSQLCKGSVLLASGLYARKSEVQAATPQQVAAIMGQQARKGATAPATESLKEDLGIGGSSTFAFGFDTSTDRWSVGQLIAADAPYTITRVDFLLRKSSSTERAINLNAYIYSNSSGNVGTVLGLSSTTKTWGDLTTTNLWIPFVFEGDQRYLVSAAESYFAICWTDSISTDPYVVATYNSAAGLGVRYSSTSIDSPTWGITDPSAELFVRVYGI